MDAARKAKLGERWVCFSCGARFYDLNKPEPLCPKCGANQHESPQFKKPKRAKKAAAKKATLRPPAPIEDEYEAEPEEGATPSAEADDSDSTELDLEDLDMGADEDLSGVEVDED